jgi:aspartate ammonia-lyase
VMMPVIAWNALHATIILTHALHALDTECVAGIKADAARARELLDRSTAVATALSPHIGYARTAEIAKLSVQTGRPIHEIVQEQRLLPDNRLEAILSPEAMTTAGRPGQQKGQTKGRAMGSKKRRAKEKRTS